MIRFVQEGRSHRAAESLKAMVSNTATVIRRDVSETRPGEKPRRQSQAQRRREIPIASWCPAIWSCCRPAT